MDKNFNTGDIVTVTFAGPVGSYEACTAEVLEKDRYHPFAWFVRVLDGNRVGRMMSVLSLQKEAQP